MRYRWPGFLLAALLSSGSIQAQDKASHPVYEHGKVSVTLHLADNQKTVLGLTYKNLDDTRYFLAGARVTLGGYIYTFTPENFSYRRHDPRTHEKKDTSSVPWTHPLSAENLARLILVMTITEEFQPARETMRERLSEIQAARQKLGQTSDKLTEAVQRNPDSVVAPETIKRLAAKISAAEERARSAQELVEAADAIEQIPDHLIDPYGKPVNKSVYYWVCHRTLSETSDLMQNLLLQTELLLKITQ